MDTKQTPATQAHACNCIGPQNGQPLCPCQMRGMIQRDGRWVRPEQDMGPVSAGEADVLAQMWRNKRGD